ncbi:bifunctional D-glycero-beta-D-manno-heptose-7-phosphate kinase/D-glycero-beta-D-manno-heptose 1-phosphate adenylyltransferase HldE [Mangrovitalea sediminis]|uniref:bifunctional D-glycero-beta-D-manno-heptose-7-phosphate kinase/D-glycero-beta-D-manno-heptose 1-phosphate adenylyltransferase HldE n=1 Tax=Mangrovitalea sediminis TaxID=1982043 RepID=UPI000BE616BF|nr:bifunctional D-glycero-beta-D-manno-heptose-7-phosphate kinase/D-glycero-beta-D-manno-heptose 1-phosphate adenylyltransferase HldE [Mangrovitalea sediminis]
MNIDFSFFRNAHVLIAGDLMLDRYWHGSTSRISPEAPIPVVAVNQQEARPGGAANVALNIAALGAKALLTGIVGDDPAGAELTGILNDAGVEPLLTQNAGFSTITKLRIISQHQQLIRADFEATCGDELIDDMTSRVRSALASADVLLLSDYAKGALRQCPTLIDEARKAGKPVLIDPKGNDFSRYRGATLLTPNLSEFEGVAGKCADEAEMVERAKAMIAELALDALLITRSEKGMSLITADGEHHHYPAHAREVFDVTGAGDTVISTLAVGLAAGCDLQTSVILANHAASIVVGKLGTAVVTTPELKKSIEHDDELEGGILSKEQLVAAVRDARHYGQRVVFTNGCFDILHAGHVAYLQEARRRGDKLVVAVNDDDSVTRLKGPGRPVNKVDNRMAVLAGLKAVDWVTSFSEDTPIPLLEAVKPDVLVKGGDYTIDQVVGAEVVRAYGGEVEVLNVEAGLSTTATIKYIREHS